MTLVGIDIGNAFCVVAAARNGGVEVILNENSKRETPTCVALGARQRFLGDAAFSLLLPPGCTIVSQIKRLIGRPLSDASLRRDLDTLFPNLVVSDDGQGFPLLHFEHRGNKEKLPPTQLLGMLLGNLKRSAERHLSATVSDCCIAVPAYFNDIQRRAVLQAAEIAGLRTLRLLHECSAAALEYGIYHRELHVDGLSLGHVTAIVDVGHSATQVAICVFRAGEVEILGRAADSNLGGRDFDEVLFNHFADELKGQDIELDVSNHSRACRRLRTECVKIKKVLSVNPEAFLNIDYFIDDKDATATITREQFEELCKPLLESISRTMRRAIMEAELRPKYVHAVELIGSGSRVPAVVRAVAKMFRQEPRRTLNASECIARGCALQASMLSSGYQTKPFQILDKHHFGIGISQSKAIPNDLVNPPIFQKIPMEDGIPISRTFRMNVKLGTSSCVRGQHRQLDKFEGKQISAEERVEVKVPFSENVHGAFSLDVLKAAKEESKMVAWDKQVEMTKNQKNLLESYLYVMRNKVNGKYRDFVSDTNRKDFIEELKRAERWLDDEGEDVEHDVYAGKLKELKTLGDPIEIRFRESLERPPALDRLQACANDLATLIREKRHVDSREKQKIKSEYEKAMQWRKSVLANQNVLPKHVDPFVKVAEIQSRIDALTKLKKLHMPAQGREVVLRKKALEKCVREMIDKLGGECREFVSVEDRQAFLDKLDQTVMWLNEECQGADCGAYDSKINELRMLVYPIESRIQESLDRDKECHQLRYLIQDMFALTEGNTPDCPDIDICEKQNLLTQIWNECCAATEWLNLVMETLNAQPRYVLPVVKTDDIRAVKDKLGFLKSRYEEVTTVQSKSKIGMITSFILGKFIPKDGKEKGPQPSVYSDQQQQFPQNHEYEARSGDSRPDVNYHTVNYERGPISDVNYHTAVRPPSSVQPSDMQPKRHTRSQRKGYQNQTHTVGTANHNPYSERSEDHNKSTTKDVSNNGAYAQDIHSHQQPQIMVSARSHDRHQQFELDKGKEVADPPYKAYQPPFAPSETQHGFQVANNQRQHQLPQPNPPRDGQGEEHDGGCSSGVHEENELDGEPSKMNEKLLSEVFLKNTAEQIGRDERQNHPFTWDVLDGMMNEEEEARGHQEGIPQVLDFQDQLVQQDEDEVPQEGTPHDLNPNPEVMLREPQPGHDFADYSQRDDNQQPPQNHALIPVNDGKSLRAEYNEDSNLDINQESQRDGEPSKMNENNHYRIESAQQSMTPSLESYVYEMKNKLRGKYQEFVVETDRKAFIKKLQLVEMWLYHESEDYDHDTYVAKLNELKTLGNPIEARFRESLGRGAAVETLQRCISHFRTVAEGNGTEFTHIEKHQMSKIQRTCEEVDTWLQANMARQETLSKFQDPFVTVAELKSKTEALDRFCRRILSMPATPSPSAPHLSCIE